MSFGQEAALSFTCRSSFTRSIGATAVLAMAAATPPAKKSFAKEMAASAMVNFSLVSIQGMGDKNEAARSDARVQGFSSGYRKISIRNCTKWEDAQGIARGYSGQGNKIDTQFDTISILNENLFKMLIETRLFTVSQKHILYGNQINHPTVTGRLLFKCNNDI